jgi:hypothetical protein
VGWEGFLVHAEARRPAAEARASLGVIVRVAVIAIPLSP